MNSLIIFFIVGILVSVTMTLAAPHRIFKQVQAVRNRQATAEQENAEFERKREHAKHIIERKAAHRYDLAQFDLDFFNALPDTKPLILCDECKYLSTSSHPHSPTFCAGVVDPGNPEDDDILFLPYVQCQCPYCNPGGTGYVRSYQR